MRGGSLFTDPRRAAVWTSPDGITWSRVPHNEAVFGGAGGAVMSSVTVGGPGLVAVGSDLSGDDQGPTVTREAAVWTSPDGINWSRVPHKEAVFGGEDSQWMLSVTSGGPGLVAVRFDGPQKAPMGTPEAGSDDDEDAAVWTSPDGITWSRVPHNEAVFGGEGIRWMWGVTVGGSGLVAVGAADSDAAVWVAATEN